jgi:hypothetical protein
MQLMTSLSKNKFSCLYAFSTHIMMRVVIVCSLSSMDLHPNFSDVVNFPQSYVRYQCR